MERVARPSRPSLPCAALLCAALALAGCSPKLFKAQPPPTETFGPTVDAVVVQPVQPARGVQINAADLNTLRELLETEMKAKQGIRIYQKPPTTLPNTATLESTLTGYRVREQNGDAFALRTVELAVELTARLGNENEPSIRLRRALSYQKVYPQGQAVAAPEFDYHNAARELAAMLAESLVPSESRGLPLVRAVDRGTGEDWSLPALSKGIEFAQRRRDGDALRLWSLVLFEPETDDERERFRVSERTLAWLRDRAVDEETLGKLAPLARIKPLELVPFRERVRKALGGVTQLESQVLQLSDTHADHVHLNLYAAHLNLHRMYLRDKRLDVASYHLSRAYAHYPQPELLEAWVKLQTERNLIASGVKPANLFWLYLRIPPPRTALVTSGAFDLAVLPPQAIEDPPEPPPPLALPVRREPQAPPAAPQPRPRLAPGLQQAPRPQPR
jgi:hypothetical protein